MKHLLFVLALFVSLAGCNTPGPHFRDLPATRISVDGSVFDIRFRGELAEAMRINPEYAPRFGPIKARAAFAFEAVSGCKVVKVLGDQALATGVLACDKDMATRQHTLPAKCRFAKVEPSRLDDPPILNLICTGTG